MPKYVQPLIVGNWKMNGTKEFDLYRINDDLPGIDLANTLMGDSWLQYD